MAHWYPAYVGLGSNLNGPSSQIESAIGHLSAIRETRLTSRSGLYCSTPFGGIEQPDFVNATAALLTRLGPGDLLAELQQIEQHLGRERGSKRWGPRSIDLDLLVYSDCVADEPGLIIPHPGIAERNFVLLPLKEIAPSLVIPGLGRLENLPVNMDEPRIEKVS